MELNNESIEKIGKFLNLEKIMVRQRIELLLYVNEENEDFIEKIDFLKTMYKNVIFNVVKKGELPDVKSIISGTN